MQRGTLGAMFAVVTSSCVQPPHPVQLLLHSGHWIQLRPQMIQSVLLHEQNRSSLISLASCAGALTMLYHWRCRL